MNLLIGDRDRWHLASIDGRNPIAVRAAVRRLLLDDNPIADLLDRLCDEIDRRAQSRKERLQSPFRRWLDYRLVRALYRAQKAGKWRLPRFRRLYPRHVFRRVLRALNNGIDRWIFDPEGNPAIDRLCYAICVFAALYIIAQIVRAWVGQ